MSIFVSISAVRLIRRSFTQIKCRSVAVHRRWYRSLWASTTLSVESPMDLFVASHWLERSSSQFSVTLLVFSRILNYAGTSDVHTVHQYVQYVHTVHTDFSMHGIQIHITNNTTTHYYFQDIYTHFNATERPQCLLRCKVDLVWWRKQRPLTDSENSVQIHA